jgi:hypothetical protein
MVMTTRFSLGKSFVCTPQNQIHKKPLGFPGGFSYQTDTRCPLSQNLGLYYAVDVGEAHITPAKNTACSFQKKEKTSRLSGRLFVSNRPSVR